MKKEIIYLIIIGAIIIGLSVCNLAIEFEKKCTPVLLYQFGGNWSQIAEEVTFDNLKYIKSKTSKVKDLKEGDYFIHENSLYQIYSRANYSDAYINAFQLTGEYSPRYVDLTDWPFSAETIIIPVKINWSGSFWISFE